MKSGFLLCFRRIISCVKLIVSGFIFYISNSVHCLKNDWRLLNIQFLTLPTHYLSSALLLTFKFRFWDKFIKILKYSLEQCIHVNWKSCWTRQIVEKSSIWIQHCSITVYEIDRFWDANCKRRWKRVFVGQKLILYRIPACFSWHNSCERRITAKNVYAKQFLSFYRNSSIEN